MGQKVVNDDSDFGWAATWASEMGDSDTLAGLLLHADRYMQPTWRDGGLYFPRNDTAEDDEGNRTLVEPMAGNVLLAYAALNVPDGLWRLYNEPWDAAHRSQAALTRVDDGIDVLQARFDADARQLRFTLRRVATKQSAPVVVVGRLPAQGPWVLSCDGVEVARGRAGRTDSSNGLIIRSIDEGIEIPVTSAGSASFVMQFES
jgi:hypothetical protein